MDKILSAFNKEIVWLWSTTQIDENCSNCSWTLWFHVKDFGAFNSERLAQGTPKLKNSYLINRFKRHLRNLQFTLRYLDQNINLD